jgi:hypothetical protein
MKKWVWPENNTGQNYMIMWHAPEKKQCGLIGGKVFPPPTQIPPSYDIELLISQFLSTVPLASRINLDRDICKTDWWVPYEHYAVNIYVKWKMFDISTVLVIEKNYSTTRPLQTFKSRYQALQACPKNGMDKTMG